MQKTFKMELAGRQLTIETGKLAQLANGSVLIRYGDTVVISTATASSKPREGIDYFPLSVDYEEKLYAVGKIPGGFLKREGKPSEKAVLTARVIDRPIRPLFPSDLRNDVTVVNTVLSVEQDNSPEVAALIGTSAVLAISDIPWAGPIGGVIVGLVDGEVVINPNIEQKEKSTMYITLAGTEEKIIMIEANANQVPDDIMLDAIKKGHEEIKKIASFIKGIVKEIGKEKFEYESASVPDEVFEKIKEYAYEKMRSAVLAEDKQERDKNIEIITNDVTEKFKDEYEENPEYIGDAIYKLEKKVVREYLLKEKKRIDGRSIDEIRPLSAEVGVLPRVHGSGLFQRGQTQVLTAVTLGTVGEGQKLDGIDEDENKRYMHHYNFPSYSVGESRPSRGPGRREIGHGALAEKALVPVLPDESEFPYALRLVSEVLMSNGSTSQGSVCGSTLALMDAGVPIKEPVAGISAGLVTDEENRENYVTFMDIQGIEDFFGDMDFKVAGTKNGITAIQVDVKIDGLTYQIIKEAFEITRKGRLTILNDCMLKTISKPNEKMSEYAPKMYITDIEVDKIRDVIGPGGKVINKIIDETGVKIDIQEDGKVFVATTDEEMGKKAISIIEGLGREVEPGSVYTGQVTKIMSFGAFVEILPGKEGLVHISQLEHHHVRSVEESVKVGDEVKVKVIEIDRQGRINLSKKALVENDSDEKPSFNKHNKRSQNGHGKYQSR